MEAGAIARLDQLKSPKHLDPDERMIYNEAIDACIVTLEEHQSKPEQAKPYARPFSEYHEDFGPVLWWRFPIQEPPYCGRDDDSSWPFYSEDEPSLYWTKLTLPEPPASPQAGQ